MAKDASDLHRHIASGAPQITPDKIGKVAVLLREKLRYGPPELRQAYARLVMDDVSVTDEEIRISGSKSVLARCAAADAMPAAPAVLSLFRSGAPDRIRTCDLCLRRAALYPAELRAHLWFLRFDPSRWVARKQFASTNFTVAPNGMVGLQAGLA